MERSTPSPRPSPPKTSKKWRSLGEREKPAGIWTQGGVRSSYSALCPGLMSVALSGRSKEAAASCRCSFKNVQNSFGGYAATEKFNGFLFTLNLSPSIKAGAPLRLPWLISFVPSGQDLPT